MSDVVVINRDELDYIIQNTARVAGAEGAKLALSLQKQTNEDRISEAEAMALIGCKKRKLASLRDDRLIEYYTNTKPYSYSKLSILEYINLSKIKRIKS